MQELMKVNQETIGAANVQTVNARDLHVFLEVKQDFSAWVKAQLVRARLLENRDFVTVTEKRERQILVDYHITLDAGKHIAMMSGTDKGFEVRDYFIECERRSKSIPQIPQTLPEALRLAADLAEKVTYQQQQITDMQPKVDAHNRLSDADGSLCLTDAAKALQIPPHKFTQSLQAAGWIYRRPGKGSFIAYQNRIQAGYLVHKITVIPCGPEAERVSEQVRVTPKGMTKLAVQFQRAA